MEECIFSHDTNLPPGNLPKGGGVQVLVSVMRSDLDASTSTEVDAHEAQWRAGVNRQARPDAASQRRAASLAAAAKRRRIRT